MWINVRPFTTASLLQILDGKCLFNFIKNIASPQFFLIHFGEKIILQSMLVFAQTHKKLPLQMFDIV